MSLVFILGLSHWGRANVLRAPGLALDSTQNPSSVSWEQVESEHFVVIFPQGLMNKASEITALLEALYGPVSESLKVSPKKLTIILHSQTLVANGFVTLAPRRSEWFITPRLGPELGQTDWLKALAVHEFRHVVQFDKSHAGFAKAMYFVLGETGTALAIGLTLPPWYLEGDAVGMETALSSSGRGRQPQFERGLKALLLDGQDWSYEQLALGSFRRWRPNHYVLGYFLTSYLRKKYGKDVLEKIHRETMERSYNPLAFYNAVERVTGKSFDHIFSRALQELKRMWRQEAQQLKHSELPVSLLPTDANEDWVSYSYPNLSAEGGVIALREGLSHVPQFVRITETETESLWTPGPLLQEFPYKLRAGLIAYSTYQPHPRWGMQDFARLEVRKVATGEEVLTLQGTQELLPTLDHEGKRLVTYLWGRGAEAQIRVRALPEGQGIVNIPWSQAATILGWDWIPRTDDLVVLWREGTYNTILERVNTRTGKRQRLGQSADSNWAYPTCDEHHVYFQSQASGMDNIHRIAFDSRIEERVSAEVLGAYHPSATGEKLLYSRYTAQGLKPVIIPLPLKVYPVKGSEQKPLAEMWQQQEGKGDLLAKNWEKTSLSAQPYSQWENFWNPHSWLLLAPPFGASLIAQIESSNYLNTLNWANGVEWNLNQKTANAFTALTWTYAWPMLDFGAAFGGRRERAELAGKKREDYWEEGSTQLGITLPWSSIHGAWGQFVALRFYGELLHATGRIDPARGELAENTLAVTGVEANWDLTHRQAMRDLLPPWGALLKAGASSGAETKRSVSVSSYQQYASAQLFSRGLLRHHHLYGELASEHQNHAGYHFASPFLFSRGLTEEFMEQKSKTSINYAFPLAYPEWSPGRYFYLKRLSINLFYDNIWGRSYLAKERFESQGIELWLDSHLVRNAFNVQWGVRLSRPVDADEDPSAELFLNTGVARW